MAIFIEREIEPKIEKWLERKEIIAIRGPRQCGKTTLLKKLIRVLHSKGISEDSITYITFENSLEKEKFEKNPLDYISLYTQGKKKHYLLLDEVQYIKNAGKLLKLVYDETSNTKIIITGSSSLDLSEIGSYLVGRVIFFELYPFSFREFIKAKDEQLYTYILARTISLAEPQLPKSELTHIGKLNTLLREYLTYGGYPAIALEKDAEMKKILLKNLMQTYIEKDVVRLYGTRHAERIIQLTRHLAANNTSIINYTDLSSAISLYDKETKEMLSILEQTYIIKLIRPYHKNLTTELRKNPKVYFIDPGLRNSLTERYEFNEDEYGKLLENYTFLVTKENRLNYWRTTAKAEVDFVLNEKIPIEVKIKPKLTRSFRSFIDTYNPKHSIIINLEKLDEQNIGKTKVLIIPAALISC